MEEESRRSYDYDDSDDDAYDAMDSSTPKLAPMQLLAQKIADDINREVESRITRADDGVLDDPRYSDRLMEIMDMARNMIRQLGVKNVIELVIHVHTKAVYNRHGRRVLDGYVLRCYGNTPAALLSEVDFGHHSVAVKLQNHCVMFRKRPENMSQPDIYSLMKDELCDAIGGKDVENTTGKSRSTIFDEGQLASAVVPKPVQIDGGNNGVTQQMLMFPVAPPSTSNDDHVPILSYNGKVAYLEGCTTDAYSIKQLLVQNHCTKAVQIAHDRITKLELNISEFYRSMAYDTCMTRGARSCVKVAYAAARAMGLELDIVSPLGCGKKNVKNPLNRIRVTACAPLTFITAVPQYDSGDNALAPSFAIHVNTFGDYDLARPMAIEENRKVGYEETFSMSAEELRERDRRQWELPNSSTDWRAYAILNGGVGSCVIVQQLSPAITPMRPYWIGGRGDQCARAARETRERLRPIPAEVLNHRLLTTTGYPSSGVFDELSEQRDPTEIVSQWDPMTMWSGQPGPCMVAFRSCQQPHQNSNHYAPLVPASQTGPLHELWSRHFPQVIDQGRRFIVSSTSKMFIKYSGGLSGACLTLDSALHIKLPLDHLSIPPTNHVMYLGAMHVALRFHAYCENQGRKSSDVLRTTVQSKGWLLNNGAGHQAFLDNLTGGAMQCDPQDQTTLLVDMHWLRYCLETLHFAASVAI